MIATTISNSISEKPFCFRISFFPHTRFEILVFLSPNLGICWHSTDQPLQAPQMIDSTGADVSGSLPGDFAPGWFDTICHRPVTEFASFDWDVHFFGLFVYDSSDRSKKGRLLPRRFSCVWCGAIHFRSFRVP
jgi:hypothetical protein